MKIGFASLKTVVGRLARRVVTLRAAAWLAVTLILGGVTSARAQQALPKTADIHFQVAADGSLNMAFQMTFDAAPWRAWKSMVGDEPARMRAMMRHQFAAMTLEDFKLERDDMNRVAKMSMHSAAGPELREDGSFQVPVDGYFRLVSHAGREWFFSGNNPNAGGTLNNVKVTLPPNVLNAYVANPDNPDQALVFALVPPPSPSRWFYLAGGAVTLAGLALLLAGIFLRPREVLCLPAGQTRSLPVAGAMPPPQFVAPATPAVPPAFVPRTAPPVVSSPAAETVVAPPPLPPRDGGYPRPN